MIHHDPSMPIDNIWPFDNTHQFTSTKMERNQNFKYCTELALKTEPE
ncbi:MAG: hypothetical protein ACTSU4_13735 [Promethearchaeota archaeon]